MSGDDDFISRWSRRKIAARAGTPAPERASDTSSPIGPASPVVPGNAATQPPAPLPPIDSLTFDSDFSAFMREGVDPDLRRAALRTLVRDPRFNVMDGLDVYIDDYSKPDPLPPEWLDKLSQLKNLGHSADEPAQERDGKHDSGASQAFPGNSEAAGSEISHRDALDVPQQADEPKTPDHDQ